MILKNIAALNQLFANKSLWTSIAGVITLQITVVQWSAAHAVFHTTALTAMDWLLATGIASLVLIFEECRKLAMKVTTR